MSFAPHTPKVFDGELESITRPISQHQGVTASPVKKIRGWLCFLFPTGYRFTISTAKHRQLMASGSAVKKGVPTSKQIKHDVLWVDHFFKHMFKNIKVQKQALTAVSSTVPETNVAPENGCLEDHFVFGKAYSKRLC